MLQSSYARTWMDLGLAGCGFAAWLAIGGCDGSATQTTSGSTTSKAIEGVLVDSRGNPVNGATVKAWPAAYGPILAGSIQDSALAVTAHTDERGHYSISGLEVGVYNLFGANPSDRATVLIPRVKYLEQAADLGTDTLKAPGAIIGKVRVDGGNPPLTFCYLEGSSYAAISDSAGRFVLPDLAEGQYRLNYFANGYARAVDSLVTVRSGDTATLAAKTLLPDLALQPPAPQGISAVYDSVHGVVHLKWNAVHVDDLQEYWIEYEDNPDPNPSYPHSLGVTDTGFADEVGGMNELEGKSFVPYTRTYWVRAKDTEGNLSPRPAQPITINVIDATIFKTEFSMHAIMDSSGRNSCNDTLAFALDVVSSPDSLVGVEWRIGGSYHDTDYTGDVYASSTQHYHLRVSVGAPHRDTLYFTPTLMDSLKTWSSQSAFDSISVIAMVLNEGMLVHMVTAPVGLDSLGCYHPGPTTERSLGKPPY
ncbi:MAG: carboxypeptidase regulatory-like domain-containing protein [Fibrobacteres bacterium]|nr:carboxypeptidase regulatory-like domain-containing protein [Fibrobacterota bacterium]